MVVVIVVTVAIFVAAPVHNSAMQRTHHKMERQQDPKKPMVSKNNVERNVESDENDTGNPKVANAVNKRPGGVTINELRLGLQFITAIFQVNRLGFHH